MLCVCVPEKNKTRCADNIPLHKQNHTINAPFSQHERSNFSTRALESKEISRYLTSIIAMFQLNYRDVFSAPFGRFEKRIQTPLNISALQQQFSPMKFARKFRPFTGFNIHEHHRQFMTVYLKKTRKFKINKKDIFEINLRIVIA